jgi:hypothetical protein
MKTSGHSGLDSSMLSEMNMLKSELQKQSDELYRSHSELEYLRELTKNQKMEINFLKQEKMKLENLNETFSVNESKHIKFSKNTKIEPEIINQSKEEENEQKEEIKCLKEFLLNLFYVLFSRYGKEIENVVDKEELFRENFNELNFKYYKIFLQVING